MSTTSKKIFIESSLLLAFIDRANLNHAKAGEMLEFLGKQKYHVFTSSTVVLQTFNAIERDLGQTIARDFLQAMIESNIQILHPSEADLLAAFRYLRANPGRQNSLSSIINANLMQKNGVNSVLTFDFWPNVMGTTVANLINN